MIMRATNSVAVYSQSISLNTKKFIQCLSKGALTM